MRIHTAGKDGLHTGQLEQNEQKFHRFVHNVANFQPSVAMIKWPALCPTYRPVWTTLKGRYPKNGSKVWNQVLKTVQMWTLDLN